MFSLRSLFYRDNKCWNRATWLSIFEQLPDVDALVNRVKASNIRNKDSAARVQAVLSTVLAGYLKADQGRLAFLHHGEEGRLASAPAHFRTGQTIENFCAEFDLPSIEFQDRSALTGKIVNHSVENELENSVVVLASGFKETLPELKVLTGFGGSGMATSDIPAAVHKALGLLSIVVEKDRLNQQMSLRLAGPKSHPLHQSLSGLSTDKQGMPILTSGTLQSILIHSNVPVLVLQGTGRDDGHFSVYLPNSSELAKQLNYVKLVQHSEGFHM